MRILEVRPQFQAEDVANARRALRNEVEVPLTTVCILHGDSAEVGRLADRVAGRSDGFPWRQAVWIRSDAILAESGEDDELIVAARDWFDGGRAGVVLDFDDQVAASLDVDASVLAIELAYLRAQQGGD